MNDTVRAAAGKHNSTSAAAKTFLHVGSSSARCNVAICRAFGVRHASTFKVRTLFPSPFSFPQCAARALATVMPPSRAVGGAISQDVVVLEKGCSKFFSPPHS